MRITLAAGVLLAVALPVTAQTSWVQSPINGHWYRLTAPQSWTSAEAEAVRDGGHLATIRSQPEQDWITRQFGLRNIWIGLNDVAVEGTFVWSSGEQVAYTNWCPGEPNGFQGNEDHVQLTDWCIDRVAGWNDQADTDQLPGLVETTSAPDGWVQSPVSGNWYRRTSPLTWDAAETLAQQEGGHLVTIRSQAELDWIVQQFGTGPLWTGLNDVAVEGTFEWSSGEVATFRKWCTGEPTGSTPDEDYVRIANDCTEPGAWRDDVGSTTIPAILERMTPPGNGLNIFGQGCAGAFGVPVLSAAFGSQLLVGGRFDLRVDSLSPSPIVVPFGLVGFGDQTWAGLNLPFPLDSIGMTGCSVFIDIDTDQRLFKSGPVAQWSLPVPNDANLIGGEVFFQSLVLEPGANPFGAVISNAGRATIGR